MSMLKGKTALVTGSTSGIGLGIAIALARQGANIVLNGFGDVESPKAQVREAGLDVPVPQESQEICFIPAGEDAYRAFLERRWQAEGLSLPGRQLIDWGGAQRWLKSDADASLIRAIVNEVGGHVTCYSHGLCDSPFQPLPETLLRYHRSLKQQLDPRGIFNPGRLYPEL